MVSVAFVPTFAAVGHPLLFVLLAAAVVGAFIVWYLLRTFGRRDDIAR